jgi:chloramphenicol 3-O phosphotransferase
MSVSISPGKIILLNGASSAGKSTLCQAIQSRMEEPFLRFSLDFFMFHHGVMPTRRDDSGAFSWQELRAKLFEGYFNCLPALALAGNNLVIDYIIETPEQLQGLARRLGHLDVFFVGVHCPLPELERRERLRGDRGVGDARKDLETVHTFSGYDFEVDSNRAPEEVANDIVQAWKSRSKSGVIHMISQSLKPIS